MFDELWFIIEPKELVTSIREIAFTLKVPVKFMSGLRITNKAAYNKYGEKYLVVGQTLTNAHIELINKAINI